MILVRRHHDLGLAKAKRLAEAMACRLQEDYGGTYTWEGHELRFQRTGATASVSRGHDQGEAEDYAFRPSSITGRLGDRLLLQLTSRSSTLHNVSVPAQGIDRDVGQRGELVAAGPRAAR